MFRTLANAWKVKELRNKILFTLIIILIYRIGACLPVPFVSSGSFTSWFTNRSNSILGFVDILSGSAFKYGTLFALGVSPYITASIVIQLLTVAIPPLERLSKQGEEGRKKISQITRYVTIAISLLTAVGYYFLLRNQNAIVEGFDNAFFAIVIIACFCAGSAVVMWLAEKINDRGLGNGISIILFANIISRLPSDIISLIQLCINRHIVGPAFTVFFIVMLLALSWFVIFITDSERRIPVQYAKKVVGRKMYGGQNSNLPIKLNMTGVMPIILANTILTIPATIAMFANPEEGTAWYNIYRFFSNTSWFYALMQFILIIAFAYFYVAITFNPIEVAGNLQKNGGSIPGIRPGKATSDFIRKVLSRVTLIGALALSVVAVLPLIIQIVLGYVPLRNPESLTSIFSAIAFGGTSIIIVVGVILETVRDLEAQMSMRHYKGFLE